MARKVSILGASGMIGGLLLDCLLEDNYYEEVHLLLRRALGSTDPRVTEHLVDFADPKAYAPAISGSEAVFSCIGTTMKQVKGDREAYRKIDFDINRIAAETAASYGVFAYLLVSSVGADPANNNNFYLKLKGVTEETVSKQAIPQVHIFRPSLLVGDRKESRPAEKISQFLAPAVSPLLLRGWRKYKPIKGLALAFAMMNAAKDPRRGIFIHEYDEIMSLALKSGQYRA